MPPSRSSATSAPSWATDPQSGSAAEHRPQRIELEVLLESLDDCLLCRLVGIPAPADGDHADLAAITFRFEQAVRNRRQRAASFGLGREPEPRAPPRRAARSVSRA